MGIAGSILPVMFATTMGFAIQRGGTCTVAAVKEVLTKKRANRLRALVEASTWVLGGMLIAKALGYEPPVPSGYPISLWTLAGAALLGLGAAINRACVFGAIANFGSGQWAYVATPVGFYLGNKTAFSVLNRAVVSPSSESTWVANAPLLVAWMLGIWLVWRLVNLSRTSAAQSMQSEKYRARVKWEPHTATVVIGVNYFFLLWLVGPWAYTDVLAEWAQGSATATEMRLVLFAALLAGASFGGWTAGRWHSHPVQLRAIARHLGGGWLMGLGSLWIPGGNDGLILTGMPLLWPYAWAAFAVMCMTIAAVLMLMRARQK